MAGHSKSRWIVSAGEFVPQWEHREVRRVLLMKVLGLTWLRV
jgi:hypothetical protein